MAEEKVHKYVATDSERNLILESLGVVKMVYMQLHLYNKVDEVNLLLDKIQSARNGSKWLPLAKQAKVDHGPPYSPNMTCDDD